MNRDILKQVRTPFTDELIKDLIEQYISCGCDDNVFYNEINNLGSSDVQDNHFTNELVDQIYAKGIAKQDLFYEENDDHKPIYSENRSWMVVSSEDDPMKDSVRGGERPLIYRFYLNLKGEEKSMFVLNYMNKCKESEIPYEFKFSKDDSRNDQIIVLSREKDFEKNMSLIEELTEGMTLGNVPLLIGEYKNKIGVAEEYYNRLYSPTQAKLSLVRSAVKKYLCDHKDEFYSQLSDDEKEQIDTYINEFKICYEHEMKDKEQSGDDYEDWKKSSYQRKSSIDCYNEHMENDSDAYVCGNGLKDLNRVVQMLYSKNPEEFINEIIGNFKTIGTEVWGFSRDFVFSNATEEKYLNNRSMLSAEEIKFEIEKIARAGLVNEEQIQLISLAEEKEKKQDDLEH